MKFDNIPSIHSCLNNHTHTGAPWHGENLFEFAVSVIHVLLLEKPLQDMYFFLSYGDQYMFTIQNTLLMVFL